MAKPKPRPIVVADTTPRDLLVREFHSARREFLLAEDNASDEIIERLLQARVKLER